MSWNDGVVYRYPVWRCAFHPHVIYFVFCKGGHVFHSFFFFLLIFPLQGYGEGSHFSEHESLSSPFISSGITGMFFKCCLFFFLFMWKFVLTVELFPGCHNVFACLHFCTYMCACAHSLCWDAEAETLPRVLSGGLLYAAECSEKGKGLS